MYLGSVRFFKHVIYLTMTLVVGAALLGIYTLTIQLNGSFFTKTAGAAAAEEFNLPPQEPLLEPPEETQPDNTITLNVTKMDYQQSYPELYAVPAEQFRSGTKTAYLTFDDGPSARTPEILDILKEHDVKATFFVLTKDSDPDILRRIVEEGHAIGIHTHTHRYGEIYASVEAFLADLQAAYEVIYRATSVKPEIVRFPGGSINSYNRGIYQELIAEVLRRGFLYYDWNISTVDTLPNVAPKEVVHNVLANVEGKDNLFILAHDSSNKKNTAKALPEIITSLKELGYVFDKIDNSVEPVVFAYPQ
ncbi:MAG: polysaccharide deacetylase [Clostridia bacterium]|nr:polysaccharide deacetylase [Clostridia bacterium]